MNDSSNSLLAAPDLRLGIRGLPNLSDSLISGGMYALVAETPPARYPVLAASLGAALNDNVRCTVVVPAHPEVFLERVESFGHLDTNAHLATERLSVFEMQSEFPKRMFRFGTDMFLRELEHFNVTENSYILFDQADELLALHDISLALDQIDTLRKWFEQRRVTALLVFSRATATHAAAINALMDNLTGIARLGADKNGLELTFDYWQSPEGTIAARNYHLRSLESGFYEASTKTTAPEQAATQTDTETPIEEVPAGEQHFFYMDPDLGSLAQQVSGVWQHVDTLVGMMHATRGKRSATLILSFSRDGNIRQLAEAAHTLRLSLGRQVRIIVREKGASLRYQNEALLLRLGVNLVVHRDVPASRLPLLIESLGGQIFSRDVNINFEAALASVLPTRLRGYLVPTRFTREVELILNRAETLNIPYAMVIGRPVAAMEMVDVIISSALSRPGDLISSDGQHCYIFLNACPQAVLLPTLQRILGMPVDEILQEVRFAANRHDIELELAGLTRAAEQGELPNYSSMLPAVEMEEEAPAEQVTAPHAVSVATSAVAYAKPAMRPAVSSASRPFETPSARPEYAHPAAPQIDTADRTAPIPAAPVQGLDRQADGPRFSYDDSTKESAYGKKAFPRASRSTPATQPKEDTISPAGL
ncbi:BcsE family c-di-GMP-binding protein [Noviherbaspirillum saxi]|uniref:Cellulose biosynthesis protein BcsE n=1 Tax=Noviherbaspirillum saxi TaxID=2320863 RepID=A0A3A3FJ59_9BURK|nr:BcsE family c-di-GMP-binding protein [Noviherbaspirillum saxi]RJF92418.1 hypothetical protein D3871_27770 [Noviherbaspirillum saxi]